MKYRIESIDKKIFEKLLLELEKTPLADIDQFINLCNTCPGLVNYNFFTDCTNYSDVTFYSVLNSKLNKILKSIFKTDFDSPLSIHNINYYPEGAVSEHVDQNSDETYVILLDDNYEGAQLYLDSKPVEFNKKMQYVYYKGKSTPHSTSKVTSGVRKVLAVFYKTQKTNKLL